MDEIILLKLGELVLKGANRHSFEERLMSNAKRRLKPFGKFKVYTRQSTTYIEPEEDSCDLDGAYDAMKRLFGAVGLTRARACAKDKDAMLATAREYLDERLRARAGADMAIGALFFSNRYGILGKTPGAEKLLALHRAG